MGKFITLGKWNKLYIYIIYYLIIQLIYEYLFDGNLPRQIKIKYLEPEAFPKNILVQESFNYLGTFLFSIILYRYEISQIEEKKENKEKVDNQDKNNQSYLESDNSSLSSYSSSPSIKIKKTNTSDIQLIYNDINEFNIASGLSIGLITILLALSVEIMNQLYVMNLRGLDFWMFEILFISFISHLMFGKQVYKHKKFAICFITVIPCLFKILSIIAIIKTDEEKTIFKEYKALVIPLGIFVFLLATLLRDYSICKIKYFLDYKYASINRILIIYGFYGSLICFISSTISTVTKCKDVEEFKNIALICHVNITKNDNEALYYDHFKDYFKDIWRDNRVAGENCIYIILMILKIFISYLIKLFSILIIKKLNQVYLICSTSIFY